jgi:outer membrane protein OmpA-like peptidoglycan-associated protein
MNPATSGSRERMPIGQRHSFLLIVVLPLTALLACATARPPTELVKAREAYLHAEAGTAAKMVPAELHVAREALEVAEKSFADSPGSQDAIDTAYIALRKSERAEALGNAAVSAQDKASAEKTARLTQQDLLARTNARLKSTQGELEKERDSLAKEKASLDQERQNTAAERAARLAAEQKAKDAMDALAKSLAVKSEGRGTVITLSGGVLFVTGQATILAGAQAQLNQVAEALKTQAEHHFSVEGYTDNQGTDKVNDDLSTRRANAVRDYLIVRGVSAAAITATGFGSSRPIADNRTVEGRAMNRRVEIIVDKTP